MEKNPGLRVSRRSCRVVYLNIWGLNKNLSDLSLTARGGDRVFCSETLIFFSRHISELIAQSFGRPMQAQG